jgi:hypothetical protein
MPYRVEAHDGKKWSFGVRRNDNTRLPEFCALDDAPQFETRRQAVMFQDSAACVCGGTLRVWRIPCP